MKIALAFPGCHRRGGVERVMVECANFLNSRGHGIHVHASVFDTAVLAAGIGQHQVKSATWPPSLQMATFARNCRNSLLKQPGKPEVIAGFGVQAVPGAVVWVQSVHKAWLEISQKHRGLSGRLKQRINPFHAVAVAMEKRYFGGRRYRKLIALTQQVKADLVRLYGVPPADIEILPNGFSPSEFNLSRADRERETIRARLGFSPSHRVIVFAANELERKGFGPLVEAVALLKDDSIQLLAVGRLDRNAYAGRIGELGLAKRVHYSGPTSDVAQYYAAGDVFALPTQYEAWGLVIVEAMACGLPVVTSRLAGAAIAVEEGKSGYLLDDPRDPAEIASKLAFVFSGSRADSSWISSSVMSYAWPKILLRYERILLDCAQCQG